MQDPTPGPSESVTRPINPISGFPEPYSRTRPARPLWFRFFGLETTMDVLSYRPGTKMLAFLLTTSLFTGAVLWDKAEAKRITSEAKTQVRELGQQKIRVDDMPRTVKVLASRIPEDSEEERGLVYFKKYIKPILVSAGIDYEYLPGQIPGSLARILLARFKVQRLEASAQSASPSTSSLSPGQQGYTEQYNDQHALGGGTVLIGRNSLKEYLWALKQAWTTPLDLKREHLVAETDIEQVEDEELKEFVRQEGLFDPPSVEAEVQSTSSNSNPILGSAFRDTYAQISKSAQPVFDAPPNDSVPQKEEERPILSPTHIPPQPPLLFVPYSHPLGSMLYWPQKLYSYFFGERANARAGAAAALSLIQAQSRPFEPPRQTSRGLMDDEEYENEWVNETSGKMEADHEDWFPKTVEGDCDFDIHSESYISKHYKKMPEYQAKNRKAYLAELPARIQTARAVSNGTEKPGAEFKTEEELLEERIKKEKRWRRELQGWRLIRPGSSITWDDQMQDKLRVFLPAIDAEQQQQSKRDS